MARIKTVPKLLRIDKTWIPRIQHAGYRAAGLRKFTDIVRLALSQFVEKHLGQRP